MNLITKTTPLLLMATSLIFLSTPSYADWGVGFNVQKQTMKYKRNKKHTRFTGLLNLRQRGEKFNINKNTASYDFTNSNLYAVEAILATRNEGYKSSDDALFNGMSKKKSSLDIGGRVIVKTGFLGQAIVGITKDVNASKGIEANIKLGGRPPHEPHWTGKKQLAISPVMGLRYQDAKTVDYYYGVKASEATGTRAAYKGKSSITPYAGLEAQVNLTPHITFDGSLGVSRRSKAIRNSPLTSDRKYDLDANIGISYWF